MAEIIIFLFKVSFFLGFGAISLVVIAKTINAVIEILATVLAQVIIFFSKM